MEPRSGSAPLFKLSLKPPAPVRWTSGRGAREIYSRSACSDRGSYPRGRARLAADCDDITLDLPRDGVKNLWGR